MSDPILEVWPMNFTPANSAVVIAALKEDGYPADNAGLHDWILDGIKGRHPDPIQKVKNWMQDNPEKVDMAKKAAMTLGRSIPFFLRSMRQNPRPEKP